MVRNSQERTKGGSMRRIIWKADGTLTCQIIEGCVIVKVRTEQGIPFHKIEEEAERIFDEIEER
jgi:hypothetical protein